MNTKKKSESHVGTFDFEKEMAAMRQRLENKIESEFTGFRNQIADFRNETASFRQGLRNDLASFREGFRNDLANFRDGFRNDLASSRDGLGKDIGTARSDLEDEDEYLEDEDEYFEDQDKDAIPTQERPEVCGQHTRDVTYRPNSRRNWVKVK